MYKPLKWKRIEIRMFVMTLIWLYGRVSSPGLYAGRLAKPSDIEKCSFFLVIENFDNGFVS